MDYATLNARAESAQPFRSLIHPDAARFGQPDNMPKKIADYCRQTGQPAPETHGQFTRCVLESLALLYRVTLEDVERLTGRSIERLHIVGGGSQSDLLNQFAASATQREVLAGPVEATAAGNALLQALALEELPSLAALRTVVRDSFSVRTFRPTDQDAWHRAYKRFSHLDLRT
jgi:rhamnulokinase